MKLEVHLMQCISCFALRGGGTSSKIWFDDGQFKAKTGWFFAAFDQTCTTRFFKALAHGSFKYEPEIIFLI